MKDEWTPSFVTLEYLCPFFFPRGSNEQRKSSCQAWGSSVVASMLGAEGHNPSQTSPSPDLGLWGVQPAQGTLEAVLHPSLPASRAPAGA